MSLGNRGGVILKRKNNTCSRTNIPGVTNAGPCEIALGYALSKGLFCLVTSLASRRSMHFGGEHIHKLFCLPPSSSGSRWPCFKMAEQALTKLDHRNEKKMLLLALEVLFVEEV